jgi:hypothetical protein
MAFFVYNESDTLSANINYVTEFMGKAFSSNRTRIYLVLI